MSYNDHQEKEANEPGAQDHNLFQDKFSRPTYKKKQYLNWKGKNCTQEEIRQECSSDQELSEQERVSVLKMSLIFKQR